MKRVNTALSIIGAVGLLFFVYATVRDVSNASAQVPFCVLFATVFLAGYLREQMRRK